MARFIIEVAGPRNESAMFNPIGQERLRGRWSHAKVAHRNKGQGEAGELLKELSLVAETIPGLLISLDTDKREGMIVDPLGELPDGRQIHAKIKPLFDRYTSNPLDCGCDPRPRSTYSDLSVDQIKEWAFYMRAMLDCQQAIEVPGTAKLPKKEEISTKWPGKRRRDPGNTGPQEAVSMEEHRLGRALYPWADEVPVEAALAASGPSVGGSTAGVTGQQ